MKRWPLRDILTYLHVYATCLSCCGMYICLNRNPWRLHPHPSAQHFQAFPSLWLFGTPRVTIGC
jgi:hypothetical protein